MGGHESGEEQGESSGGSSETDCVLKQWGPRRETSNARCVILMASALSLT